MVSSTPAGSGLPIGLMPGALPSDHASRQTLNTTAMRFFFGQDQLGLFIVAVLLAGRLRPGRPPTGTPRSADDPLLPAGHGVARFSLGFVCLLPLGDRLG